LENPEPLLGVSGVQDLPAEQLLQGPSNGDMRPGPEGPGVHVHVDTTSQVGLVELLNSPLTTANSQCTFSVGILPPDVQVLVSPFHPADSPVFGDGRLSLFGAFVKKLQ